MGYIELKGQLGRKVHDDLTHLPGILGGGPPGHLGSPPCDLLSSSRLDLLSDLREAFPGEREVQVLFCSNLGSHTESLLPRT